jgi:hypothetical protein
MQNRKEFTAATKLTENKMYVLKSDPMRRENNYLCCDLIID